jgi:hypothetical protein
MKDSQLFFNRCFDKNKLKYLISWSLRTHGEAKTLALVEKLKDVGFFWATQAGISLSLDDLRIPKEKNLLLESAEKDVHASLTNFSMGNLTAVERLQQLIDAWHKTSEVLKQEVVQNFRTTDPLNPVYMMAFSGARGNLSQVRQLVGMRGLMADPQGRIIDFPIRSNFREGLTLTEYVISCYGARKGLVDTALRTATSGYLTRRLVDVAQHVVVSTYDCETKDGVLTTSLTQSSKVILSLYDRLLGRVLAEDIPGIAYRNQPISDFLATQICQVKTQVLVRSSLTCKARNGICQLCYGWSLGHNDLVSIGEAVGIIAAQSIGEPGTQLTMRTFHTGGVFSGEVIDQIESPCSGVVRFTEVFPGTLVRTSYGKIGFLTRKPGFLLIDLIDKVSGETKTQRVNFPTQSILFVRQGQKIQEKELLFEYAATGTDQEQGIQSTHLVTSPQEGEVFFEDVVVLQEGEESENRADQLGSFWILSGTVLSSIFDSLGSLNAQKGDVFYEKSALITTNVIASKLSPDLAKNITVDFAESAKMSARPKVSVSFSSFNLNQISYVNGNYIGSINVTDRERVNYPVSIIPFLNQVKQTSLNFLTLGLKNTLHEEFDFNPMLPNGLVLFSDSVGFIQFLKLPQNVPNKFNPKKLATHLTYTEKYSYQSSTEISINHFTKSSTKQFRFKGKYFFNKTQSNKSPVDVTLYYSKKFKNANLLNISKTTGPWLYSLQGANKFSLNLNIHYLNFIKVACLNSSAGYFLNFNKVVSQFNNSSLSCSFSSSTFQLTKKYFYSSHGLLKMPILLNKFFVGSKILNTQGKKERIIVTSIALSPNFKTSSTKAFENFSVDLVNKQMSDSSLFKLNPISSRLAPISISKTNSLSNVFGFQVFSSTSFSNLSWDINRKTFWFQKVLTLVGQSQVLLPPSLEFAKKVQKFNKKSQTFVFSPTFKNVGKLKTLQNHTAELVRLNDSETTQSQTALVLTRKDLKAISINNIRTNLLVGSLVRPGDDLTNKTTIESPAQILSIKKNELILRKATPVLFSSKATFHVFHKDFIKQGLPLITLSYRRLTTGDIVQGIPRIEQLFEARQTSTLLHDQLHELFENYKTRMRLELAARKSFQKIQRILIDSIQRAYQTQGVMISDKHVEIIVKQMTSTVKILEGGRTRLLRGELKPIEWIERINSGIDLQKAEYEPILLGITKASLETESFISAASFQETTRTLSRAALEGRTDFLRGLKENVILGHRIPAGTGAPLISYLTNFQSEVDTDFSSTFTNVMNETRSLPNSKTNSKFENLSSSS